MRLYLTTLFILLLNPLFAAKVTIEVRNAYDGSAVFNASLKIHYETSGMSKTARLDDDGTFKFKVRDPVTVKANVEDDRYFGQALYLTRDKNGTNQVVYIYPTRKHDKVLLEEDGCKITNKKSLATLEKESEELNSIKEEDTPDSEAIFPGGTNEMKLYLSTSIRYPQLSMELGDQAKVYIEFIVNKDGSISCVQSKNDVPAHIEAESLRVIRNMPAWKPAKAEGETVRARCRIPINFKLE